MEHTDVEKKIHEIRNSLIQELKRVDAIDEKGNAKDINAFERIIDKKIKELNALEPMVTTDAGVVKERYSANIFFHHLELLNEMRAKHRINIEPDLSTQQSGIEKEKKLSKKMILTNGLSRIIKKFTGRKKTIEKVR